MTRLRSSFQDIQVSLCRGRVTSVVMRRVLYGSRRFCIVSTFSLRINRQRVNSLHQPPCEYLIDFKFQPRAVEVEVLTMLAR